MATVSMRASDLIEVRVVCHTAGVRIEFVGDVEPLDVVLLKYDKNGNDEFADRVMVALRDATRVERVSI